MVDGTPTGDREQPGDEAGLAGEGVDGGGHGHERVLGDVVDRLLVDEHLPDACSGEAGLVDQLGEELHRERRAGGGPVGEQVEAGVTVVPIRGDRAGDSVRCEPVTGVNGSSEALRPAVLDRHRSASPRGAPNPDPSTAIGPT